MQREYYWVTRNESLKYYLMVELQAYIPDDERDAVLDRLLILPENKVYSRCSIIVDVLWLQEKEPKVGIG